MLLSYMMDEKLESFGSLAVIWGLIGSGIGVLKQAPFNTDTALSG
jgi:hypothetical protein